VCQEESILLVGGVLRAVKIHCSAEGGNGFTDWGCGAVRAAGALKTAGSEVLSPSV
jgi:hypothetical protein